MPGRADMGRRPARPRDGHLSKEIEKRNNTFETGCQLPASWGEGGGDYESQMKPTSEVHADPPGEGSATKLNRGARSGHERIVR